MARKRRRSAALSPEEILRKAQDARFLLELPVYQETWDQVETELYDVWLSTPNNDPQAREAIWLQVKALYAMRTRLEDWVGKGEQEAKIQLAKRKAEEERDRLRTLERRDL